MSNLFRRSYTVPIPADAESVDVKGIPSVRYKKNGKTKTAPLTANGQRMRVESPTWYGWVEGRAVKLFRDAVASQQKLAELLRTSERQETGLIDRSTEQRKRPLSEHLQEWADNLRHQGNGEKYVRDSAFNVRLIVEQCEFVRLDDISASRVERCLAELRAGGPAPTPLADKEQYTRAEVAAVLGVKRTAIGSIMKYHRLTDAAAGMGKARRYPREVVEALLEKRGAGASIKTSNLYLSSIKAFCAFLVSDGRLAKSPVAHLKCLDVQHDRRHDRRLLDEHELADVIGAAERSSLAIRNLSGPQRAMLYRLACATGFRARELAVLRPLDFDFNAPNVTLSGRYTKNKKKAIQPLPPDVAEAMKEFVAHLPANKPIWPGPWFHRAAGMIRIDLEAVGIPYIIEGPDGPLFADFHSLRHSFVGLLDKSGATLKEAMQLARHSDPRLTMKIYGRARAHDLAGAVERLPTLKATKKDESQRIA